MQPITILVAVALAAFFVWVILRTVREQRRQGTYTLRKSLFTPAERAFLTVVDRVVPDGVRVFGKVRLEDIFGVVRELEGGDRMAARNRINRKHVDFLLVRETDLAPLAGIELDDSSHAAEDRQERDRFVDSAFASADLPLLHVAAQKAYSPADIKARLAEVLEIGRKGKGRAET